ncbi:MAG: hypothetical protein KKB70_02650 [Proteobacteria bacterium]|nr:hypothetical protein [Pseudomonadota bacterium]
MSEAFASAVLETRLVGGKAVVIREANVGPDAFGGPFVLAVALMLTGFALVMLLERLSRRDD